jgi:hypothetical protein
MVRSDNFCTNYDDDDFSFPQTAYRKQMSRKRKPSPEEARVEARVAIFQRVSQRIKDDAERRRLVRVQDMDFDWFLMRRQFHHVLDAMSSAVTQMLDLTPPNDSSATTAKQRAASRQDMLAHYKRGVDKNLAAGVMDLAVAAMQCMTKYRRDDNTAAGMHWEQLSLRPGESLQDAIERKFERLDHVGRGMMRDLLYLEDELACRSVDMGALVRVAAGCVSWLALYDGGGDASSYMGLNGSDD